MSISEHPTDGRGPWLVCLLAALSLTGITGVVYAFGVFFEPIQRSFDLSSERVSLLFSVHTFLTYAVGAAVGYAVDRYSSPRLLALGAVCWLGGLVATAYSGSYVGVLVAFGLFVAVGFGITYIVIYATVARWFDRRLGLAMSILSTGFGLGGLIGAPAAERLLTTLSWAEAYLVLAIPTTVVIVGTAAAFLLVGRTAGASGAVPANSPAPDGGMSLRTALGSVRFLVATIGFTCGFYAFYALLVHFVPYAVGSGVTRGMAALGLGLISGASIPARLLSGHLSDRYGRISVLLVGYALMTAGTLGLIVAAGPVGFVGFALLFGLGAGAPSALYSPIVADIFGDADIGKMLGLTSVAFGIAGVLGPAATGAMVSASGSYTLALLVATALSVVGAGLTTLAYDDRLAGRTIA